MITTTTEIWHLIQHYLNFLFLRINQRIFRGSHFNRSYPLINKIPLFITIKKDQQKEHKLI